MAVRKSWLECAGVVLLAASGWQGLCAEDQTDEAVTADGNSPPAAILFEDSSDTGFVFLNAEYLPPPYLVQATADSVTLNGRPWPVEAYVDWEQDWFTGDREAFMGADDVEAQGGRKGRSRGWGGRWRDDAGGRWQGRAGWNTPPRATRWVARSLIEDLQVGCIVVVKFDQVEVISTPSDQHDFFVVLLNRQADSDEIRATLATAAPNVNADRWNEWASGITVMEELRVRAGEVIDEIGATAAANDATIRANRRLDTLAYPLTVLGMMLGVLALGHLLKSFSRLDDGSDNLLPPEVLRATTISIGLVVALSLFDLTWTILASQAGQMRELNPLGSRLITDATALIAFKFAATLVGCGLLFALRHHRRARLACWWLCLVCTVLTFRWVMFNSMFVA